MALSREQPRLGCVFQSDQGIEYAAHEYRDLVAAAGLRRSMSRKATPLDNAMVESFFHTLKTELVHLRKFENDIEAVQSPASYVRACV
jgi:putative transposase